LRRWASAAKVMIGKRLTSNISSACFWRYCCKIRMSGRLSGKQRLNGRLSPIMARYGHKG
jgi:hypothetical protein